MRSLMGWMAGAALALGFGGAPGKAGADERLVVVELYTSQGCSSCPPADKLFAQLSDRDDVLPLALHVDYWDYIGWKDSFADPAYADRQRAYAKHAGVRTVYTPQMIIGGIDHLVGNRSMELGELIEKHGSLPPVIELSIARSGNTLAIIAQPARVDGPVIVQLVRYMPEQTVQIGRGENAGRTITYTNIVTDWRAIERWTAQEPLSMNVAISGDDPVAVILQEEGPGPVLAAAVVR